MSWQNALAKIYLRHFVRKDDELDSLKTQRELSLPEPPRSLAARCERSQAGAVRSFWIDRENVARGVLVYLHGGAFYFGPIKEHWQFVAALCRRARMAALVIDFRLSPLFPFPDGFNDIIEVVTKTALPANWFFVGDSSGGGMAVSAVFRLKEMRQDLPKKLILLSPWLDATLRNPAIELNKHEDAMLTVERLLSAAREYAARDDACNPLISPMFGDLRGLPPVLIQTGTADLLLWDCRKFYLKCLEAGVAVKYEEYENAFHDFMMAGFLPETRRALQRQAEFLWS